MTEAQRARLETIQELRGRRRAAAIDAAVQGGEEEVLAALGGRDGIAALGRLPAVGDPGVAALCGALDGGDSRLVNAALKALAGGPTEPRLLASIVPHVRRAAAREALLPYGAQALAALLPHLSSDDRALRGAAVSALAPLAADLTPALSALQAGALDGTATREMLKSRRDPLAIQIYLPHLQSEQVRDVKKAVDHLLAIGGQGISGQAAAPLTSLFDRIQGARDPAGGGQRASRHWRQIGDRLFEFLATLDSPIPGAAPQIAQHVVRSHAASALLGRYPLAQVEPRIAPMLDRDTPDWQRRAAMRVIAAMGPAAAPLADRVSEEITLYLSHQRDSWTSLYETMTAFVALELPDDRARALLESVAVCPIAFHRRTARADLVRRGLAAPEDPWADCPFHADLCQAIDRVGARWRGAGGEGPRPFLADWCFYSAEAGTHWQERDPRGELSAASELPWLLASRVAWPSGRFRWGEVALGFVSASENFDVEVDGQRRVLLILAEDDQQFYWCVDLAEAGERPQIYRVDHGDSSSVSRYRFKDLLMALRPVEG